MRSPVLSIIMSVYNGAAYLNEAMDSIINQTYQNWELIVIDDASTDMSYHILTSYQDSRIILLRNTENLKLAASLNKGLGIAKGEYIVRMDADDVCRLDRLERQLEFMHENPDIDISWGKCYRYQNNEIMRLPQLVSPNYNDIQATFLFQSPIMHNCIIAKRQFYETFQYNPEYTVSEDWNLWYRSSRVFKFACQNEYLMLYRTHDQQTTNTKNPINDLLAQQYTANFSEYAAQAGMAVSAKQIAFHVSLIVNSNIVIASQLQLWFHHLITENKNYQYYKNRSLLFACFDKTSALYREHRLSKFAYLETLVKLNLFYLPFYIFHKSILLMNDQSAHKRGISSFQTIKVPKKFASS